MTRTKNEKRTPSARDRYPVLAGAEAAMKRAGERARRLAAETTGELVVFENGCVVCVPVPRTGGSDTGVAGDGEKRRSGSVTRPGPEAEALGEGADDSPESR